MSLSLPKLWSLPSAVRTAFGARVQEQRVLHHAGHLLLVLHEASGEPVLFWREPNGEWRSTAAGRGLVPLKEMVGAYAEQAQLIEKRLGSARVARDFFEVLVALRPLEHRARELGLVVQRASEHEGKDLELQGLAMRAAATARHLALLVLRTEDGRDFDLAQLTEEQADISNQMVVSGQRLNFLVAMLLPMTALTSIFGMNLIDHQGSRAGLMAASVVLFALLLGGLLSLFVARMPKQLRRDSQLDEHLGRLADELEARTR